MWIHITGGNMSLFIFSFNSLRGHFFFYQGLLFSSSEFGSNRSGFHRTLVHHILSTDQRIAPCTYKPGMYCIMWLCSVYMSWWRVLKRFELGFNDLDPQSNFWIHIAGYFYDRLYAYQISQQFSVSRSSIFQPAAVHNAVSFKEGLLTFLPLSHKQLF